MDGCDRSTGGTGTVRRARRRLPAGWRIGSTLLGAVILGCLATAACASPGSGGGDGVPSVPAVPTGPTGPTGPASPGGPADSPPGDQVELARAADRLDAALRHDFPDRYAGVVLAPSGRNLIVYRRPSPALDAALRERFPETPVETRDAPHSARELESLAARVRGDAEHWRRRGVPVTSVAVRPDGTAVEVGTTDVARASAELPRRYGRAPLEVVEAGPALVSPGSG